MYLEKKCRVFYDTEMIRISLFLYELLVYLLSWLRVVNRTYVSIAKRGEISRTNSDPDSMKT